jgi:hypothetical protein
VLIGDAQGGAIGSVMTYSGMSGPITRYCRSYAFELATTGFFTATIIASGIGPNGVADYLAPYVFADGTLQTVQYQNINTAASGFSVSASTSDLLSIGSHTIQFCVDMAGNLTSAAVTYRFKVLG